MGAMLVTPGVDRWQLDYSNLYFNFRLCFSFKTRRHITKNLGHSVHVALGWSTDISNPLKNCCQESFFYYYFHLEINQRPPKPDHHKTTEKKDVSVSLFVPLCSSHSRSMSGMFFMFPWKQGFLGFSWIYFCFCCYSFSFSSSRKSWQ